MRTTRRLFLSAAAAAWPLAGATADPYPLTPIVKKSPSRKITILGAGLAGLSAAYELNKLGHQVTVLEARSRPGGRVHTLRQPFYRGVYAEAGAIRVPANHAFTMHYVHEFLLPLEPCWAIGETSYCFGGVRAKGSRGMGGHWPDKLGPEGSMLRGDEQALGPDELYDKYVRRFVESSKPVGPTLQIPEAIDGVDAMTFPEWLIKQGASPAAAYILTRDFYYDKASAGWSLIEEVDFRSSPKLQRIVGGNDRLPYAFARRVDSHVRYGAKALAVTQSEKDVTVVFERGGMRESITADYLLCALPYSVLRSIDTTGALSGAKRDLIRDAEYASVSRVYLQTRSRFWQAQGLDGRATTDLPLRRIFPGGVGPTNGRGILHSYVPGPEADLLSSMTQEQRVARTMEQMEKVYPEIRSQVEGSAFYSWADDPFARGAFSAPNPGQLNSTYLLKMAAPDGRIHFAGEHLSPWIGWMNGALFSGRSAAQQLA